MGSDPDFDYDGNCRYFDRDIPDRDIESERLAAGLLPDRRRAQWDAVYDMDRMSAIVAWWAIHLKELFHDLWHICSTIAIGWFYKERQILKDILEEKLERRHGEKETQMFNPMTIVTDINLVVTAVTKIQAAMPQIEKTVADIRQAEADKSDTAKLDADLVGLLADVQADLADIAALVPPTTVTAPTPVATPPAAA